MSKAQATNWEQPFAIAKTDEDKCLVFGWLSVAVEKDGNAVIDSHGDIIPVDELEGAAYDFVLRSRTADQMHDEEPIGKLVESVVMSAEKQEAMGIPAGTLPQGWWVGFKVEPAAFAKVKSGQYRAFSIGGAAFREAA